MFSLAKKLQISYRRFYLNTIYRI